MHFYIDQLIIDRSDDYLSYDHCLMKRAEAIGHLQLCSRDQKAARTDMWCIAWSNYRFADDTGTIYLGDLYSPITARHKLDIKSIFQTENIEASNVLELIWELKTYQADPYNSARAIPLLPRSDGLLVLRLPRLGVVKRQRFNYGDPLLTPNVRTLTQLDYARLRAECIYGGDDTYKKYIAVKAEKFRCDYKEFLGPLPDEGVLIPHTTKRDSFTAANGTALTSHTSAEDGFTWSADFDGGRGEVIEIQGNQADLSVDNDNGYYQQCIANADVSTDDHITQADYYCSTSPGSNDQMAVTARHTITAPGAYVQARRSGNPKSGEQQIYEWDGSSFSELSSGEASDAPNGTLIGIKVDGTDATYQEGGSDIFGAVTSITGYTRGGLLIRYRCGADNWQIADIAAGGTILPQMMQYN